MLRRHDVVGAAIGLAGDDGDFRHGRLGEGEQELGPVLDQAFTTLRSAAVDTSRTRSFFPCATTSVLPSPEKAAAEMSPLAAARLARVSVPLVASHARNIPSAAMASGLPSGAKAT